MAIRHHVREIYFFVAGSSFLTSLAPCNRKRGVHGDDGRRATITRFMTYANRRRAELPRTIDLAKIDDRIWYVAFSWRIHHIFWWPRCSVQTIPSPARTGHVHHQSRLNVARGAIDTPLASSRCTSNP